MPTISLFILAKNESANIYDCIKSAEGLDEVVVIDDFSTDDTKAIAESLGAKVFQRALDGFATQVNFGQEKCSSDWHFMLDADERFSPDLLAALREHVEKYPNEVGEVIRHNEAFGQKLSKGPLKPDWVPRLFPKGTITWSGLVHPHAHTKLPYRKLRGHLVHFTYKDWPHYLNKLNRYADLWAQEAHRQGKKTSYPSMFFRLSWNLFKMLIINLGLFGGPTTWALCYFNGSYTLSKYLKLMELNCRPLKTK